MQGDVRMPLAAVYAFLLVLARVSGAIVFVPIPGAGSSPTYARAVLALSFTMALYPLWPVVHGDPGIGLLVGWMATEAAFGITVGLVVGFVTDAFILFSQIVALQAGYSYASTIDPNTQADSGVLSVLAQLLAGLLFFALGLHRDVLMIFARSLEMQPPGSFTPSRATAEVLIRLGSGVFSVGLRLALPVIALLVMVDLALALLGRINSQLQLLSLAFPVKMMASLALLAAIASLFPRVYARFAGQLFEAIPALGAR